MKHSVLGIASFVIPVAIMILTVAITLLWYWQDDSAGSEALIDQLGLLLPVSFIGLCLGFLAMRERNTRKKFVKWGLVACAVPTCFMIAAMLLKCCQ